MNREAAKAIKQMNGGHKYRAERTECSHRHKHDSKKEAARCDELHLMQRGGLISMLAVQVTYPLNAMTGKVVGAYKADFDYRVDGKHVTEDVKGVKTALYRWKAKHFAAQYGREILET